MQGQQVSHYRLTEKLGAGTYGEVWKGVHVDDPDFTVAVKLVSPQVREDPAFLKAMPPATLRVLASLSRSARGPP